MALATTDALEAVLVDHMQGTHAADFDFVGTGIGTATPAVTDTALANTTGAPARVQGTMSQPTASQHRVVATVSYSSALAITEVGLFNALSSGTLALRETFSAINVDSNTSIQFTITITMAAQTA